LVQRVLEAVGYTVLSAADGQEALDILKERPGRIHLVVTDIVMPRMSGPELLSRIRQEHPGCKGLYMSGYSDKALFPGQFPRSEAAHLQKPFSPGALAMRVREVLEAPVAASSGTRSGTAGPHALDEVIRIGAEIADALDDAHRRGILHRDLKPGNIVLTTSGTAKILDFGLAGLLNASNTVTNLTKAGTIFGSLSYMAPEQL